MQPIGFWIKTTTLCGIFALTACGGDDNEALSVNQAPSVTFAVTAVNQTPVLTSPATANVDENTNAVFYTAAATDSDGDTLSFSIAGGADAALFTLNPVTGELHLTAPADFEAPNDADSNGLYDLIVAVVDGNDNVATLSLTVELNDVAQLAMQVAYPTPNANLGGGVETTSVAGTIEDIEDGVVLESDVSAIEVNGLGAEVDTTLGEVAHWRVQVPVANNLDLILTDNANQSQQASQALKNSPSLAIPRGMVLDSANERILMVDMTLKAVVALDLRADPSNNLTILSDPNTGSGPNFDFPADIVLDTQNNRALVVDFGLDAIVEVDLETGQRSLFSADNNGSEFNFAFPRAIVLDSDNNRALVTDINLDAVIAVDLGTGVRTILSDDTHGSGLKLATPQDIVLDHNKQRLLLVDSTLDDLIAVDLSNGDRTIISNAATSDGVYFVSPFSIALDSDNNRALVTDTSLNAVIAVDLLSGDRTILSNTNTGSGAAHKHPQNIIMGSDGHHAFISNAPPGTRFDGFILRVDLQEGARTRITPHKSGEGVDFRAPNYIEFDNTNNRLLVTDSDLGSLITVDLSNGNRHIITNNNIGSGVNLLAPRDIALDNANNRALLVDTGIDAIVAVDLNNGNRTIIANDNVGSGVNFDFPAGIALDRANNRALVVDAGIDALVVVDLTNGNRTIIADDNVGSGVNFVSPVSIALDRANNRALVVDPGIDALVAVDLSNGNRTIIADDSVGSGVNFSLPQSIVLDERGRSSGRALVVDNTLEAIIAVDLSNGNRTIIADSSIGSGVNLTSPQYMALDSANNRAFVTDFILSAVIAIDLTTGERAVSSKGP